MTAVVLGLLAATFYGAADFCGGLASKRATMLAVTFGAQATGLVLIAAAIWFFPGTPTPVDLLWGLAAGVCGGAGIGLLYHALSIGKMGVVSPVTAVIAALFPVVVGFARGERPALWQCIGFAIALIAVVLISYSREDSGEREISTAGVKEAIAAGVVIGGFLLFLSFAHKSAGMWPLAAARVGAIALLGALALATRTSLRPPGGVVRLVLLAGSIDMLANVLYVLAVHAGYLTVAVVLTSLYPASTVFLARIVLKERLQLQQKVGVALALAGVALIAS
ncbi:MAG: EamA family transporter [Vulcanimicrobiaceae bacterium]